MSTVEDVRKAIQDFLAPELRTIAARLDAIDKKFESQAMEMRARFETADAKLEGLHREMNAKLDALISQLALERRLAKLEARQETTQ